VAWLWAALGALVLLALIVFLYWTLVITEGAYLGRRVVIALYDHTPAYYDRIKEITWKRDAEGLADPMLDWLAGVERPLVLDVGTGTGRFPKAMLEHEGFDGAVWGLDLSVGMLRRARDRLTPFAEGAQRTRWALIREDADALPFPDECFDAVACLETLEFTPRPVHTLSELLRVLRPGGVLLLTNRIGRARWFPGRVYDDETLVDLLCDHPLSRIEIHTWNTFYDQVWVRKHGDLSLEGRGEDSLENWLRDPEMYETREGIVTPRSRA
jgi:ubiquinone/menaquinone biosynthesis C-methylase UbiE